MSTTTIINKTRIKKYILACANEQASSLSKPPKDNKWDVDRAFKLMSGKKYTQVSQDLLDELDRSIRELVKNRVQNGQQTGKTVR